MPNRLAHASSPYLLQHAGNPVDWHEWGGEALAIATELDLPIFLSVGYSACHWCHVMAHESFENHETAAYMNGHFVNIKVDREERPDIDRIYMDAVQAMTGQGGWPMSVFLTPDGRPIMAGTYFPPEDHPQRPSFRRVMGAVVDAWRNRRQEVDDQAERLTAVVQRLLPAASEPPGRKVVLASIDSLVATFDESHGGFGGAPKFPQAPNLEALLRVLAQDLNGPRSEVLRQVLSTTFDHMAAGGIYDHLGGGFARYAVDRIWLVPHFEKMLYDNALLARAYLRAWQVLGKDRYREVAVETLDYLLRDMRDASGGLHSAEDADSEGEEGKYYVWSAREFASILGNDAEVMARLYGVTPTGNFEGANILHIAVDPAQVAADAGLTDTEWRQLRARSDAKLLSFRETRVRPGRDDKVVTAWNGLAVRALAEAGAILKSPRYLNAASEIARSCLADFGGADGHLLRSVRNGRGTVPGFCEDYGSLAVALLTLYQATGEDEWFSSGQAVAARMVELFSDASGLGFFATGRDSEELIARPKNFMDNPTPSDNSLAAEALQMLHALSAAPGLRTHVDGVFTAAGRLVEQHPSAVGHLIGVLAVDQPREVAIVGSKAQRQPLTAVVWETFRPDLVLAQGETGNSPVPLLADRSAGEGGRAYVCEGFVCRMPVDTPQALRAQLTRPTAAS
jgi:uncharacterized protein YyaL (SSP411 family)